MRPLPIAPGGAKFLIVSIDYFTKWVEAKPLISTTGNHIEKFVWEHIMCRFRIPQIIISDNGKQFTEGIFLVFCQRLGILQAFTSVYHPQANGQVEVTNRDIVKGIEQRLGKTHQGWVDELPHDFDVKQNVKRRRENLNMLEERMEIASIREAYYK
ncbi:reverse transcriptase domain-containing protein [Tanacetum coccineum]